MEQCQAHCNNHLCSIMSISLVKHRSRKLCSEALSLLFSSLVCGRFYGEELSFITATQMRSLLLASSYLQPQVSLEKGETFKHTLKHTQLTSNFAVARNNLNESELLSNRGSWNSTAELVATRPCWTCPCSTSS